MNQTPMCDCYDEEFEEIATEVKEKQAKPVLAPLQVAKSKRN
jgi:hypothetical protein